MSGEIVLSDGEIAILGSCGREDSLQNDKQKFPINLIRYANQSVGYKTKMHQSLTGHLMHFINGFTQCHACVVQTTTRYAGVHKKLYKKITNRITIRMFKSIVKKKGDFNGK